MNINIAVYVLPLNELTQRWSNPIPITGTIYVINSASNYRVSPKSAVTNEKSVLKTFII